MIGVVVVHYEDPVGLRRVLRALEPEGPRADLRIVVADDGSADPPDLRDRPHVDLVTQEDLGFRAAAARNLGARHLLDRADREGEHLDALLFLDGDTMPTPEYVDRLTRALADVAAAAPGGRALAVGRRRYADLDGLTDPGVAAFLADPDPARTLPDTTWLDDGYAATANLREADDRSYRFVISAVLAVTPEVWKATGGFDGTFVGYGGEDWEFAQRAWLAGADLVHVPEAVAWHDGPDAAGRDDRDDSNADGQLVTDPTESASYACKLAETLRVAATITEPGARDPGLIWEYPDVVVTFRDGGLRPADVLLTCADLVRGTDACVWLADGAVLRDGHWPGSDPRVRLGPPPPLALARARFRVDLDAPIRLTRTLDAVCATARPGGGVHHPGLRLQRTRDLARGVPLPPPTPDDAVRTARPDASLEAEWGWRSATTLPVATVDEDDPSATSNLVDAATAPAAPTTEPPAPPETPDHPDRPTRPTKEC